MFLSRIKVSASDNERGRKRGPSAARRRSSRPGTEPRHPVLMTDFLGGGVAWGGANRQRQRPYFGDKEYYKYGRQKYKYKFSVSNERSARGSHLFWSQTMMTRLYHQTTMTSLCHGTLIHRYTHYICSGHWLSRPFALEDKVHCSKYLLRSFQKCTRRLFTERPMHVGASIITLVNLENDYFALRIFNAWFQ